MSPTGCTFTLPIESESAGSSDEESTLLTVDTDSKNLALQGQPKRKKPKKAKKKTQKPSRFGLLAFTLRMIRWHILLYLAVFASLYATFHFGFDEKQKKIILQSISLLDDWKQLMFFFGIYLSFSVKKVSDVSSVS